MAAMGRLINGEREAEGVGVGRREEPVPVFLSTFISHQYLSHVIPTSH